MGTREMLLVIEIMLTVAAILLGHHCWVFMVQAFLKFMAVALILACRT